MSSNATPRVVPASRTSEDIRASSALGLVAPFVKHAPGKAQLLLFVWFSFPIRKDTEREGLPSSPASFCSLL